MDKIKLNIKGIEEGLKKTTEAMNAILETKPYGLDIEAIVKDIRERQDNAIAMEFTKCIGELLKKNGVVPRLMEYTRNFETDKTFETRYGVSITELDFSEHDKMLGGKIASLEEKVGYYKDSLSRVEKNCDKLHHENKELKQRIAELEDECGDKGEINRCLREQIFELEKEGKVKKINLNDHIKVKLTPLGADIYYHQYDEIKGDYPKIEKYLTNKLPRVDNEGYTEFQLHHFIELYGGYIGVGKKNVIEPLDIIVAE